MSNITFLSEMWLKPNEINFINDLFPDKRKKFLFQSDMTYLNKKGRPFGGIGLIFDSSYQVIEHKFLNRHLAFFHLKQNNFEIIIIGAYMPFDNSNNRDQSKSIYELTLSYINVLIKKFKDLSIPVVILGDFNADLNRNSNNRFDKILRDFVKDNDLIVLDEIFPQKNNFTFTPNGYLSETKSKIDHVMVTKPSFNKLINAQCEILNHITNTSDHNAINLTFEYCIDTADHQYININKESDNFIDFEDPITYEIYNKFIDDELVKLDSVISKLKGESPKDNQTQTNQFYDGLCSVFENGNKRTIEYVKRNEIPQNFINHGKKWFGVECQKIKDSLIEAQKVLDKDPNNLEKQLIIKILHKNYRSAQRRGRGKRS